MMADFERARSEEQKEFRMTEIKDATKRLFDRMSYHEVTLTKIAIEAGWSRAALYKYVTTKEDIFLDILLDELRSYAYDLHKLTCDRAVTNEEFATKWSECMLDHSYFLRFGEILLTILETNADKERLSDFKVEFISMTESIVNEIADRFVWRKADSIGIWFALHSIASNLYNRSKTDVPEAYQKMPVCESPQFVSEMTRHIQTYAESPRWCNIR